MDKVNLKNIQREKILHFLNFEYGEVTKEKSKVLAILSIIILYSSVYFFEYKLLWGVIFLVPSCFILRSLYVLLEKVEYSKKMSYLYHGIYTLSWSFSFGVLSYALLKQYVKKDIYWLWIVLLIAAVCTIIITIVIYKKRIAADYYMHASTVMYMAIASVVGAGVGTMTLLLRPIYDEINSYFFLGTLSLITAIVLCVNVVDFFVRVYCYQLLENEERENKILPTEVTIVENVNNHLCQKAKKWMDRYQIEYISRNIAEKGVNAIELETWHEKSGCSINDLFDTTGVIYKSMKLQKRLDNMTDEEKYELLAKNNSLLKLPLIVCDDFVLIGFRENVWEEYNSVEEYYIRKDY